MARPTSVFDVLTALGLGTATAVGSLGMTACVGNPAPEPFDAGRDSGASVSDAGATADDGGIQEDGGPAGEDGGPAGEDGGPADDGGTTP